MNRLSEAINPVVRIRSGALQTPLLELAHRRTNSNISVVGMVHVGDQQYYDTVATYISQKEEAGAIVHYEGLQAPSEAKAAQYAAEMEQVRLIFGGLHRFYGVLARSLDLTQQKQGLAYSQHWENHDMSAPELMRRLGPESVARLTGVGEAADSLTAEDPLVQQLILRGFFRIMPTIRRFRSWKKEPWEEVMVDDRNAVALEAVDASLASNPDQDLVLLWGAIHAVGISSGLQQRGYRVTGKRWFSAFQVGFTPDFISETLAALAKNTEKSD